MATTIANFVARRDAGGKFVVLAPRAGGDDVILAFSDFTRDSQHAHIVARWRAGFGRGSPPEVRVAGGGWWRYEAEADRLVLYGSSAAYGKYNPSRLRSAISESILGEKSVVVES